MKKFNSIIGHLSGGLGNQLFEYAATRAAALRNGLDLVLDTRHYDREKDFPYGLNHFNIIAKLGTSRNLPPYKSRTLSYAAWRALKLAPLYFKEYGMGYKEGLTALRGPAYVKGFWQSQRYFSDYLPEIRQELTFSNEPDTQNARWLEDIQKCNSLSLHVRRGDYISSAHFSELLGACSMEYYKTAVELIATKTNTEPVIYVFSDDPQWARENLNLGFPIKVIEHNGRQNCQEDLRLMAACKNHIIANSTFSWWGAWLNPSPNKMIIAPDRWYEKLSYQAIDTCPDDWIRISK